MPYLTCTECNAKLQVNTGDVDMWNKPNTGCGAKKVIGSATCRKCGAGIGFEIADNVVTYVSGKSSYGKLEAGLTEDIKMLYAEAELCFRSGTPNATAAMCRACIELSLNEFGCKGENLFDLIKDAGEKKKLDDIEIGLAHSSRLITRDAIHRREFVSLADVPSMLSATVRILNKLSSNASSGK